jgi:hypothetical protein
MPYDLDTIELEIRSLLGVSSISRITPEDITNTINDAYKDIASRSFCIEESVELSTIPDSRRVRFSGINISNIVLSSSGNSLLKVDPRTFGYSTIQGLEPKYWFQWGEYIVLDPMPDSIYSLMVYISKIPSLKISRDLIIFQNSSDMLFEDSNIPWQKATMNTSPIDLPEEFKPCILDYCLYALSLKLARWKIASEYYNIYINNLVSRKQDYIKHYPDKRSIHSLPENQEEANEHTNPSNN